MVSSRNHVSAIVTLVATLFALGILSGCGGAKILKKPKALELQAPLAVESDSRLAAGFDWVIVRDGPGTWSKNADWDEYLFRVHNLASNEVTIESIVIYDSMETMIPSSSQRKKLIKGTKAASKRYKNEGIKVKAGLGGAGLVAVGGASYVAGASLGAAVLAGAGGGVAAGAVAVGAIFAAPVLAVGGVFRGMNTSKVSKEIDRRHTDLPLTLSAGDEITLDLFFPLSPSPVRIEINYSDVDGMHLLAINTAEVLDGLHLRATEREEVAPN